MPAINPQFPSGVAPFDTLKPFSFSGIRFPYKTYTIHGAVRTHVHDYPHSDLSAIEKLGRSLYEVTVVADFESGLDHPKYYKQLSDLTFGLHGLFETSTSAPLHVPHIGTFRAVATEWKETAVNTNRSGITAEFKFVEDLENAYLVFDPNKASIVSFQSQARDFQIAAQRLPDNSSIWSLIDDLSIKIFGIIDQAQLYSSLFATKIESFTQLLAQTDRTVKSLGDPEFWEVREALDRFRSAALDIRQDLARRDRFLREFNVVFTMSVGQIADAIYGDFTRGGEIMQLNILPDPLQVAAGTVIRYYQPEAA